MHRFQGTIPPAYVASVYSHTHKFDHYTKLRPQPHFPLNIQKTVSAFRVKKRASILIGRTLPKTQHLGALRKFETLPAQVSISHNVQPGIENISIHQEFTGTKLATTCAKKVLGVYLYTPPAASASVLTWITLVQPCTDRVRIGTAMLLQGVCEKKLLKRGGDMLPLRQRNTCRKVPLQVIF